jgi:hypothetical protein
MLQLKCGGTWINVSANTHWCGAGDKIGDALSVTLVKSIIGRADLIKSAADASSQSKLLRPARCRGAINVFITRDARASPPLSCVTQTRTCSYGARASANLHHALPAFKLLIFSRCNSIISMPTGVKNRAGAAWEQKLVTFDAN